MLAGLEASGLRGQPQTNLMSPTNGSFDDPANSGLGSPLLATAENRKERGIRIIESLTNQAV